MKFLNLIILLTSFVTSAVYAETSAMKLQSVLNQLNSLSGDFSQSRLDLDSGESTVQSSGKMLLQRPGLFRWHYDKPYEQIIVADGKNVWFYDVDLDQVSVRESASALLGSPAAVLVGGEPIANKFDVTELLGEGSMEWFELTPKVKDGSYRSIDIGLKANHIAALKMKDEFGRHMLLEFTSVEVNPNLKPESFEFTPPEGVDVVGQAIP